MTRSASRILKHAEIHVLQDVQFWTNYPSAWSDSQEILRTLRYSLREVSVSSIPQSAGDGNSPVECASSTTV